MQTSDLGISCSNNYKIILRMRSCISIGAGLAQAV
jgi:hypothetical protein